MHRPTPGARLLTRTKSTLHDVGNTLVNRDTPRYSETILELFAVRKTLIAFLLKEGGGFFDSNEALEELHEHLVKQDVKYLMRIAHQLLSHRDTRGALDLASRYQSIICWILPHDSFEWAQRRPHVRAFSESCLIPLRHRGLRDTHILSFAHIRNDLAFLEKHYENWRTDNHIRTKITLELVGICGELYEYYSHVRYQAPKFAIVYYLHGIDKVFNRLHAHVDELLSRSQRMDCPEIIKIIDFIWQFTSALEEFFLTCHDEDNIFHYEMLRVGYPEIFPESVG